MGGERFCIDFPDRRAMVANPRDIGLNFFTEFLGEDLFKPNDGKLLKSLTVCMFVCLF